MSAVSPSSLAAAGPARDALRVELVSNPGAEWDAWVREREDSTFCHLAGWRQVLQETLGARGYYLAARDAAGDIAGVLPLARVKSLLGDYLVSLPFLNYGGSLGTGEARSALAHGAIELGRELAVGTIELRSRVRERSELRPTDRRITVMLELPETEEALWSSFPSKLRSQVRRPQKEAMRFAEGSDQLDAFHRVFAVNMRDLGTPVLPKRFFEAAARAFPGEISFFAVYHGEQAVAAGCGFFHGDEFEITWASSLRSHNRLSPNMLLYWESMKAAIARGARRYNFGRCAPGGGTHRFKRQWGGVDVALGWSSWPGDAAGAMPSADRPVFRLATGVWQRMPLWSANRLGPLVSRWLP